MATPRPRTSPGMANERGPAVTGAAGGAVRDVLCAEIPYVLRRGNLYASAAAAGAGAYIGLEALGVSRDAAALVGAGSAIAVRLASIRWQLQLPVYQLEAPRPEPLFSDRATARFTGEFPAVPSDRGD